MQNWLVWLLFFAIIVLAHFLEGITGFGSTALSIVFLSLLLTIEVARPLLMLYTMLLCIYVLAKSWRQIDWKHFAVMFVLMLTGLPVGIFLYNRLPENLLLGLLAAFMIFVSGRGILIAFGIIKKRESKTWPLWIALFFGGIMQGAFSTGGPLIILYSTEKIQDKSRFRATMCLIWLVIDAILMTQMAIAGQLLPAVWTTSLYGLPALIAGMLLGDVVHKKVSQAVFLKITYAVLLISGVLMFMNL